MAALDTLLKDIETKNQAGPYWIVGPETGHMLYWLIRVVQPEVAIEIGTSVGYSALWMAKALEENSNGQLWTVESHAERFAMAQGHIEESGLSHRIIQVKGHAPEIFSEQIMPESVDFAFFDATKKQHQEFFDVIYPRMAPGGMIVVDNVLSHRYAEMAEFIERTHEHGGLKVVEIPVGDGLLIARVV